MKAGLTADGTGAGAAGTGGGLAGFIVLGSCIGFPSCDAADEWEETADGGDASARTATIKAGGAGLRWPLLLVDRVRAPESGLMGSTGGR